MGGLLDCNQQTGAGFSIDTSFESFRKLKERALAHIRSSLE